ncbi:protein ABHD11-like isoform X1 [Sitophilus oryzae]|uniref:sn-1-specific diacylglycerol lipase ABHD11 n=1 Tax=Sitophilus oryzae TaxID=7048 RepID=A0A6J2XUJ7_SITOR|nr:protein ABHD11-like isoform X1 [Sitophilus oryzae]
MLFSRRVVCKLLKFHHIFDRYSVNCSSSSELSSPLKLSFTTFETEAETALEPPFIILHGLFGSKQNWTGLSKAYHQQTSPQRKIIALDLRNHGESPHTSQHSYEYLADDLQYFLKDHSIGKIALMGHSMGGRCAMLFTLQYPKLVEKLIIVDISPVTTSPKFKELSNLFNVMNSVKMPENVPLREAQNIVDKQLSEYITEKSARAFLLTNLIKTDHQKYKWRFNIPALLSNFQNIVRFPPIDNLKYEGNTLFIGGAKSDYIEKSDYPKILKLFPKAELQYIEGAGHWVHIEKPNDFLKITLDFLNKTNR